MAADKFPQAGAQALLPAQTRLPGWAVYAHRENLLPVWRLP
jgi:hypothetical protein